MYAAELISKKPKKLHGTVFKIRSSNKTNQSVFGLSPTVLVRLFVALPHLTQLQDS